MSSRTITIHNLKDSPLSAPYAQLYSQTEGKVYDYTHRSENPIVDESVAEFEHTVIPLTKLLVLNAWALEIPELPNGEWHLIIKDSSSVGSESVSDEVVDFAKFQIAKGVFVQTPILVGRVK